MKLIDSQIASGRTTALALSLIAYALQRKNEWVMVKDHYPGASGQDALYKTTFDTLEKLGLKMSLKKAGPRHDYAVMAMCPTLRIIK